MKEIEGKLTLVRVREGSRVLYSCNNLTIKIFKTDHETKVSNCGESTGIKACFFQKADASQNFLHYQHIYSLQNRHCFFESVFGKARNMKRDVEREYVRRKNTQKKKNNAWPHTIARSILPHKTHPQMTNQSYSASSLFARVLRIRSLRVPFSRQKNIKFKKKTINK